MATHSAMQWSLSHAPCTEVLYRHIQSHVAMFHHATSIAMYCTPMYCTILSHSEFHHFTLAPVHQSYTQADSIYDVARHTHN